VRQAVAPQAEDGVGRQRVAESVQAWRWFVPVAGRFGQGVFRRGFRSLFRQGVVGRESCNNAA